MEWSRKVEREGRGEESGWEARTRMNLEGKEGKGKLDKGERGVRLEKGREGEGSGGMSRIGWFWRGKRGGRG